MALLNSIPVTSDSIDSKRAEGADGLHPIIRITEKNIQYLHSIFFIHPSFFFLFSMAKVNIWKRKEMAKPSLFPF
jgi:hypothetical protein